ncbi:hypothetical protein SAMN05444410_102177 [Hydrobacter penzbergensis]|uniref:Effector-binding domain-containing protein n=1 Tax=Hydrobacter penzbergensis TaxID=1235997 RepID=A0A8X8IEE4_9BACT|nr:hypothetical protein [Hydrobacter penzbergensis]SDW38622.1 hypothetical protein SAMN05444410_102177 [Hydrobacter penzbergensis]
MKKWVLVIVAVFFILIASVYFFIPGSQVFNYKITVNSAENGVSRMILDKEKWATWWPGKKEDEHHYNFGNYHYRISNIFLNSFTATVAHQPDSVQGLLQILPSETDSTQLLWTSTFSFSANPFTRIAQYRRFSGIKSNIQALLDTTKLILEKQETIYGMKIVQQKVTDSSLISLKKTFPHYPTTNEIYEMVRALKNYIATKGGTERNYPMLNVYQDGPDRFETMVAIPTQKDLPSEGLFRLKKMVLGNILMAEVTGGVSRVMKGEQELTNYVHDYRKTSPAIPYQSLVTDRSMQPDSARWITRLYYPIFF